LAVNYYVEPVYTLEPDIVVAAEALSGLTELLEGHGSDLRIQFTTDEWYQEYPSRATTGEILGVKMRIASLEDVTQGKIWAFSDPARHLSERKKDELDLVRLAEVLSGPEAAVAEGIGGADRTRVMGRRPHCYCGNDTLAR
jgi:hypothetical protein